MSTFADDLASVPTSGQVTQVKHPPGWEPGLEMRGHVGSLTSHPVEDKAPDWSALLQVWDLDPDQYEVVEPVQYRAWDAAIGNGETKRMYYYRASIRRRPESRTDVDELVRLLSKRKKREPAPQGSLSFFHALGDTQIGKSDGDGSSGTIVRFRNSLDFHLDHFRSVRKQAREIVLPWLGDCIEGNQSQGGALRQRNDLTLTEQIRVYRRLMLEQVKAYASLGLPVTVVAVPGNHDEVERINGKLSTRFDDSWAVDGAAAVADAVSLAGMGEVKFIFPRRDELTVTYDASGTLVGMAHGHQFGNARGGWEKWWEGQASGRTPIGHAHILLAGHLHHWHSQDTGRDRTFIQVPALDGGSTWFRHLKGADSRTGSVSFVTANGIWDRLRVG